MEGNYLKKGMEIIIVSLLCLIFNAVGVVFLTGLGLTGSAGWFQHYLARISFGVFYVSFFLLFLSGIAMVRKKLYSRKLGIFAATTLIISGLILILSWLIFYVFEMSTGIHKVPLLKSIRFYSSTLFFHQFQLWAPIIYAAFLIIYLTAPKVKEQFK